MSKFDICPLCGSECYKYRKAARHVDSYECPLCGGLSCRFLIILIIKTNWHRI